MPKTKGKFKIDTHVERVTVDGVEKHKCKLCGYKLAANHNSMTRWVKHVVIECKHYDVGYKMKVAQDSNATEVKKWLEDQKREAANGLYILPTPVPNAVVVNAGTTVSSKSAMTPDTTEMTASQASLAKIVDNCSQFRSAQIDTAVTRFSVENGISFHAFSSPSFHEMAGALNAAYRPISSKTMIHTQLPKLHREVSDQLREEMKKLPVKFYTLGIDGFKNESNKHVYIVTLARGDHVMFFDCKPVTEAKQGVAELVRVIKSALEKVCQAEGLELEDVESVVAGVVFDNTKVNPLAGKELQKEFPKLFVSGCRAHAGDLLMEDIASIPAIKKVVKYALRIAQFVKKHSRVLTMYERMKSAVPGATSQKTFPSTRFAYMDLTLDAVVGKDYANMTLMRDMIASPTWEDTVAGIKPKLVKRFQDTVMDSDFLRMIEQVRKLTKHVSAFIHHLERPGARPSWPIELYLAMKKDLWKWSKDLMVEQYLGVETCQQIKAKFEDRYFGRGSKEPIYHKEQLLAMILDPLTAPTIPELNAINPKWKDECVEIFEKFFEKDPDRTKALKAEKELLLLLSNLEDSAGTFGGDAERFQAQLALGLKPRGPDSSEVGDTIDRQKGMMDICDPTNSWRVYYSTEFPTLGAIAVRLVGLAIQSADVERCCKVNKLVHSKSRNRLKNENVVMLLSCYVNMRLLRRFKLMRQLASIDEVEADGVGEDILSSVLGDTAEGGNESDGEKESDSENESDSEH